MNLPAVLDAWLDAAVAWLRVPVTPTAIRWEALNVAAFAAATALAAWAAADAAVDWRVQMRQRRNGGNLATARQSARAAALRALRVAGWLVVFVGFALNWDRLVVLVAFAPLAYAANEIVDQVLSRLVRLRIQAYYEHLDRLNKERMVEIERKRRYATGGGQTDAADVGGS